MYKKQKWNYHLNPTYTKDTKDAMPVPINQQNIDKLVMQIMKKYSIYNKKKHKFKHFLIVNENKLKFPSFIQWITVTS